MYVTVVHIFVCMCAKKLGKEPKKKIICLCNHRHFSLICLVCVSVLLSSFFICLVAVYNKIFHYVRESYTHISKYDVKKWRWERKIFCLLTDICYMTLRYCINFHGNFHLVYICMWYFCMGFPSKNCSFIFLVILYTKKYIF